MTQKTFTLKSLKETLVNYSGDADEMVKVWNILCEMRFYGFINEQLWNRFFKECHGWTVLDEQVVDTENGDKVIWTYTAEAEYRA